MAGHFGSSHLSTGHFGAGHFGGTVGAIILPNFGTVVHGRSVALGKGMTHMDGVGWKEVATPLDPENET